MCDDQDRSLKACHARAGELGDAGVGTGADAEYAVESCRACLAFLGPPHSAGHYAPADGFGSTCRQGMFPADRCEWVNGRVAATRQQELVSEAVPAVVSEGI